MDRENWLEREVEARIRDQGRPWWQAKERPANKFEAAPIFWTLLIGLWLASAIIPAILLIMP